MTEADIRRAMAEHAAALLDYADRQGDHLLGALVADVQDRLMTHHLPEEPRS